MTQLRNKPVVLMILDGFGYNPSDEGNAVTAARTPHIDRLRQQFPHTIIKTSGMDVGLPEGQMGNSEVGHTNIGAGRIVYQELTRISKAVEDDELKDNPALSKAMSHCIEHDSALHLYGLLSDGGVHSHQTHLYALLKLAKKQGVRKVFVHTLFDGRDVPPDSALEYTRQLTVKMDEIGTGRIASLMGRYYAMDRDNRWERVELAWKAMVLGEGVEAEDPVQAVADSYEAGIMDEFVKPTVIMSDGKPVGPICQDDAVIFFNFRPDRAREMTRAMVQPDFKAFDRPAATIPACYVTMTQYDVTFDEFPNLHVAFRPTSLENTFGATVSRHGLKQLRIAETEKYAHVTFFFNGGLEKEYEGEERCLIPSPKVATYDMQPEMSAYLVAEEAVRRIEDDLYDVIILNFANCDMVGHTGVFEAAVAAVEAVDSCVGKVTDAILSKGGIALITADHGNAEQMMDPVSKGPFTAHTNLDVELILAGGEGMKLKPGRLADLAPTMLSLMDLPVPTEMSGQSLVES